MKVQKLLLFVLFISLFSSCKQTYKLKFDSPKKINIDQKLLLSVSEKQDFPIDSVQFMLDGKKIDLSNGKLMSIKKSRLGKHLLSASVFFGNESKKINHEVYFLADKKPTIYTYKIINSYPHDQNSFTQGLEYHKGYIYESTGQHGKSYIRKWDLKTGKVLKEVPLDKKYFGEGMTIFDDKIVQLTWQSKKGFVYDLNTFSKIDSFAYNKSKEGWGISHNNKELIKSDGSERIWFLDPSSFKEKRFIEAYTNKRKAERLNEIEYIEGKIYANIWQKNAILIINSENGAIEGIADLNGLKKNISANIEDEDQVLNGIAYDKKNKRLFVTGKNWDKLFEIVLVPKN